MKGAIGGRKEVDAKNNPADLTFNGDYWMVTLNARVDVLKFLEVTKKSLPLSLYGRVGAGPLYYRALMTRISTGAYLESAGYINKGQTKTKRRQTTVIPYGLGLAYDFSYNLHVEADVDLFNAFTDNLDAHTGNTPYNDKFFFISGALVYSFDWNNFQVPMFTH